MKAVFDFAASKPPKDVSRRYRLPNLNYVEAAQACIGSVIILRETSKEKGRSAYVAFAKVASIVCDGDEGCPVAILHEYMDFPHIVPLRGAAGYLEASLQAIPRRVQVGSYLQNTPIRWISDQEFSAILTAGGVRIGDVSRDNRELAYTQEVRGPAVQSGFAEDVPLEREHRSVRRLARDSRFRFAVCGAYRFRCAVTGSAYVNTDQEAEVEAAHIVPIASRGPDTITNGISLSRSVHWLFDSHLLAIADDWQILRHPGLGQGGLLTTVRDKLWLPEDSRHHPHQSYLAAHRKQFEAKLSAKLPFSESWL